MHCSCYVPPPYAACHANSLYSIVKSQSFHPTICYNLLPGSSHQCILSVSCHSSSFQTCNQVSAMIQVSTAASQCFVFPSVPKWLCTPSCLHHMSHAYDMQLQLSIQTSDAIYCFLCNALQAVSHSGCRCLSYMLCCALSSAVHLPVPSLLLLLGPSVNYDSLRLFSLKPGFSGSMWFRSQSLPFPS